MAASAPTTTPTAAPRQGRMTLEEFMSLPDDGYKYELVNGELKVSPAGMEQEDIVITLANFLKNYVKQRRLGRVYGSSTGYRLPNGNIRSPDVSFVCQERLPGGKSPRGYGDFPPDLAVEVLAPGDKPKDLAEKIGEYLEWGVRLIWVVDADRRTVAVYRSLTDIQALGSNDVLSGEDVISGFKVRVDELFE